MKAQWIKLCTRLDAMSLRERMMVFCAIAASIVFLAYTMVLEPLLAKQKVLLAQINQQQNQIGGIDREIAQMAAAFVVDPDAEGRARLHTLQKQIADGSAALLNMQKGLVAPEKVAPLLEHILRGNGKLRLISMKTLPVSGLSDSKLEAAGAAGAAAAKPANTTASAPAVPKPRELLYRHGVEIVLQGNYLDMIQYMDTLQGLPNQLFWGKAKLDAGQYPASRLTLTLYTLSLDTKWMKL